MFPSKNGEEKAQSSFRSDMNYINHLGIEAKHIISYLFTFRFTDEAHAAMFIELKSRFLRNKFEQS